jgi:hypothetical protein
MYLWVSYKKKKYEKIIFSSLKSLKMSRIRTELDLDLLVRGVERLLL